MGTTSTSELAALSSERRAILEAFAEASSDALLAHDRRGRITTCNRSAERIVGYLEAEIVGQPISSLFPDHLGDLGPEVVGEQRRDGLTVPVSLSVRPLRDEHGDIIGAVSIAQDVTEMRLAQATLAEVEARLRGGEAQVHVGRWLWDVGTGAVQWSDELHRIHGVDPLDFAGTLDAHVDCAHPDDRDRLRQSMEDAVRSGHPFEHEYRVVRPDGSQRRVYLRAEPMDPAGPA